MLSVFCFLLVLYSGVFLGQQEQLHESGYSVIKITLEEQKPDDSDNNVIVKLDGSELEAISPISPVSGGKKE